MARLKLGDITPGYYWVDKGEGDLTIVEVWKFGGSSLHVSFLGNDRPFDLDDDELDVKFMCEIRPPAT